VQTSQTELVLRQSGDTYGPTKLSLRNRFGANGALFISEDLDLVDFGFQSSTGTQMNLRMEHRGAYVFGAGNTNGEFQFFDLPLHATDKNIPMVVGKGVVSIGAPAIATFGESNTKLGVGTASPHSKLEVAGAITSGTVIKTVSSDDFDVSGVNTVFINITADIVLGGLVGGVDGQVVVFAFIGNFINHCRFEHAEGIGGSTQDFINHTSADEDIDHGGCIYVCNGTNWYDVSHAKHV